MSNVSKGDVHVVNFQESPAQNLAKVGKMFIIKGQLRARSFGLDSSAIDAIKFCKAIGSLAEYQIGAESVALDMADIRDGVGDEFIQIDFAVRLMY